MVCCIRVNIKINLQGWWLSVLNSRGFICMPLHVIEVHDYKVTDFLVLSNMASKMTQSVTLEIGSKFRNARGEKTKTLIE